MAVTAKGPSPPPADWFDADGEISKLTDILIANQQHFTERLWMLGVRPSPSPHRDSGFLGAGGVLDQVDPHRFRPTRGKHRVVLFNLRVAGDRFFQKMS